MGLARREGRAIVEDVLGLALGAAELLLERVDRLPVLEDVLLLPGEGEVLAFNHVLRTASRWALLE